MYGARSPHSGRPRGLPRSRTCHAAPMCCKDRSGLEEGGAVFERITARLGKGIFQPGECSGKPLPGLPASQSSKRKAFAFAGRSERGVFRDHPVLGLLGQELYVGLRVGPGSEPRGEERRSIAKVSWTELTSAFFR